MNVQLDVRDSRLLDIIAPDTDFVRHLTGFKFTEGPIWHPSEQHLRFSDITGNSIYQWSAAAGLQDIRPNSHMANGNTYDRTGRMLTCHHASSAVTRTEPDSSVTVLAAHYAGKQLNSPNDIVVKRDGMIYFTDPPAGRMAFVGIPREQELPFAGVFRIHPETREITLLTDDFVFPNGLCFSLDERQLYINDTRRFHIRVFDVLADGTLANGRVFAETTGEGAGVPDGMKFDSAGHLFCVAQGGVHVFLPDGSCLGRVLIPEQATNFVWGDADLKTLYVTATTSVYRLRVQVAGLPMF